MKITKRITAVLLAFALLISMMPPVFAETTDDTVLPPQATGISSTSDQVIAEAPDKNENALVVNMELPKIRGVAVVYHGANNAATNEKIKNCLMATLSVTSKRIYISGKGGK